MKRNRATWIAGIIVLISMSSGCLWAPELDRVQRELKEQLPGVDFKKEFAISLGPLSLGLARSVVRFVPDGHEAHTYLKEIRRVKIAIYNVNNLPRHEEVAVPDKLRELLENDDWEQAVRVSDHGQWGWVLYRAKEDTVREIYVVVLSDHELVMVRAEGRIDRILRQAVRNHVDSPDGYRIDLSGDA